MAEREQERLRAVAGELDHLRDEAADLAADLRKRLHALILQRQAVERLVRNRQGRIEHQSATGDRSNQQQARAA
jgi:hypothetical protein